MLLCGPDAHVAGGSRLLRSLLLYLGEHVITIIEVISVHCIVHGCHGAEGLLLARSEVLDAVDVHLQFVVDAHDLTIDQALAMVLFLLLVHL